MKLGKISKFLISTVLATMVVGTVATASGCTRETDHPIVRITYSFNEKDYELDYTLYRNMYPSTVRHFIELSKEGFYNNTVIHDMQSSDWFAGAYAYDEGSYASQTAVENMAEYYAPDNSNLKENEYLELFENGKLTPSVFSNVDYDKNHQQVINTKYALPVLMGEFENNIHQEIESGALTAEYGCLKMYYHTKSSTSKVYVKSPYDGPIQADYKNNCATSVFALQVTPSSKFTAKNYCVFASVRDDKAFGNFIDEVESYLNESYGASASSHYLTVESYADVNEAFSKDQADRRIKVEYYSPKTAIVIKNVKIISY